MLAKNVHTTHAFRQPASSLTPIASMLAPTGGSTMDWRYFSLQIQLMVKKPYQT